MALELKQELKLSQQLVMTPQLQMAIKFLQLSRFDLLEYVKDEMQQNPVLEDASETDSDRTDETGKIDSERKDGLSTKLENNNAIYEYLMDAPSEGPNFSQRKDGDVATSFIDTYVTTETTLANHLLWQLHLSTLSPTELEIGEFIIGNLNDDGYLKGLTIPEIAEELDVCEKIVEGVLRNIQEFDPWGIGAGSLEECLLIQARLLPSHTPIVEEIIERYLPYLETKDYNGIAKGLGVSEEMVEGAVKIILGLEPKPGRAYSVADVQYVTPDVFVRKIDGDYTVTLNDDGMPKLKISRRYRTMLKGGGDLPKNTKEYIQKRLQSALWLIKSIHQRQKTLLKITKSIVEFQREFLDKGLDFMKPLILREVADNIGVHESTVSRVTTNKYASTPQGVIELKGFFKKGIHMKDGNGVLCDTIKDHIKRLVASENPGKPFSDKELVRMLRALNIDIARRTVAKYRENIGIGSSSKRKRTAREF